MRKFLFIGLMASAGSLAAMPAAAQQTAPPTGMMRGSAPVMNGGMTRTMQTGRGSNWGHRVNGRWWGGYQAPGGWNAYRRPVAGFVLPGFWLQPSYYISDYGAYGLPAPAAGYGWSRYYDDAVLTDQYGAVYDSRIGYDWDRYGGYDDYDEGYGAEAGYARDRRGDGGRVAGGAVIGGVTGGLLGTAIAGPGNRTEGAILGAGLGAIAGAALADSTDGARDRYAYDRPGYSYGRDDRRLRDNERKLAREEAKQRAKLDKLARKAGYANYGDYLRARAPRAMAPAMRPGQPHWAVRGGPEGRAMSMAPHIGAPAAPHIETQQLPGYVANGYYYPGTTITTITLPPTVTTTTRTYVTRTVTKSVKARKVARRKAMRACTCN